MPSKTQEKDMLCIRSNNRDGKLVLLQIWDNSQGVHVQYFHKLMRYGSHPSLMIICFTNIC